MGHHTAQLRSLWPSSLAHFLGHRSLCLVEIVSLGEGIVLIRVVRDHVLERSHVSHELRPRCLVYFLELLYRGRDRGEVLHLLVPELAFPRQNLRVLNLDLPTQLSNNFTMVNLMRASVPITLFTPVTLAYHLVKLLVPAMTKTVRRPVPILQILGQILLVICLLSLGPELCLPPQVPYSIVALICLLLFQIDDSLLNGCLRSINGLSAQISNR